MKLYCSTCGRVVSNELPKGSVVRAVIECPECYSHDEAVADERRRCTELAERHRNSPSAFDLVHAIHSGYFDGATKAVDEAAARMRVAPPSAGPSAPGDRAG